MVETGESVAIKKVFQASRFALVQVVLMCLACQDKRYKNRELQIMKDMVCPHQESVSID